MDGENFQPCSETPDKYDAAIFSFVSNENGSYLSYAAKNLIENSGQIRFYVSILGKGFLQWNLIFMDPIELCDVYASCGAFSICNLLKLPRCGCLEGFEPKILKDWEPQDHSNGCGRKTPFESSDEGNHAFLVMENAIYPMNPESFAVDNTNVG